MNMELVSSSSTSLMTSVTMSRPALSWCSKCGQSMEISSESVLLKSKTNFKFRKIFDFDSSEVLIKTFSCALVDDILLQGTLYTSQNHFCFFSRIANKHKKIVIAISQIVQITKEKTAGIFPNAIAIKTQHNRHLLASFVYREVAFRCLNEVWSAHQAERFNASWNTTDDLLDDSHRDHFSSDINDPFDEKINRSAHQIRKTYRSKDSVRKSSNKSIGDKNNPRGKNEPTLPFFRPPVSNAFNFIYKDGVAMLLAIVILLFLMLYIVVLAWKIQNLQVIFLEQVLNSNSLVKIENPVTDDILCPITEENNCNKYVESVHQHQSKMTRVQTDLKETLNLLQTVVKLSSQMFDKIRITSLRHSISAHGNIDEI